jgi:hypothetical protein
MEMDMITKEITMFMTGTGKKSRMNQKNILDPLIIHMVLRLQVLVILLTRHTLHPVIL